MHHSKIKKEREEKKKRKIIQWGVIKKLKVKTPTLIITFLFFLKILFIYFFREGEGKEKERERNINVWLPLRFPTGDLAHNPARALTGNLTSDPLVHKPTLNPLSYTSQGQIHWYFLRYSLTYLVQIVSQQSQESGTIILSVLWIWRLRLREGKSFV